MKSITEQGSSIEKAIKTGWEKAGKPTEFSVKVFEEPKRNFIGMTVSPAKIGIFFELPNPLTVSPKENSKVRPHQAANRTHRFSPQQPLANQPKKENRPYQTPPAQLSETNNQKTSSAPLPQEHSQHPAQQREIWTEQMMVMAREWLTTVLASLDFGDVSFVIETSNYDLKFILDRAVFAEVERQQQLYRGLSLLLMQTLRHKLRRPLRGFRVIIINN